MGKIASKDVRERAVGAYKLGKYTQEQVAEVYKIHPNTLKNWLNVDKRGEEQVPKKRGCRPRILKDEDLKRIDELIKENPSITLESIREKLGVQCSLPVIHRAVKELGYTYKKKTLWASETERNDIVEDRAAWQEWAKNCSMQRMVFIDESSAKTNSRPIFGRALRGERCFSSAPGSWKTTTMLSSIRCDGTWESMVFEGSVNKVIFSYYMENMLLPTLQAGDIVIMDNLSAHKNSFDTKKFEDKGITIKYLPPYSPDLNPIEMMWSKIKGLIKKSAVTTINELFHAVEEAFKKITPENAFGWFTGCGYSH